VKGLKDVQNMRLQVGQEKNHQEKSQKESEKEITNKSPLHVV
jgi:hypothetical protein